MREYLVALTVTEADGVCECHGAPAHIHVAPREQLEASILRDVLGRVPLLGSDLDERIRKAVREAAWEARADALSNTEAPE